MTALALALTRYSREALNHYIEVWMVTYETLYSRPGLTADEDDRLCHEYVCGRLQELVEA